MERFWEKLLNSDKQGAYIDAVNTVNKDINAFIDFEPLAERFTVALEKYKKADDAELGGVPFALKGNIALEGNLLSCASELLSEFITPNTATAVKQLLEHGMQPIGITNMDEFGMGADSTNTIYGSVHNPWDLERTAGGSSGGAGASVAAGCVPVALGSDTGGSVRQPACFCGTWGLKPTYGAVSRYGLVAFASSLDVIGFVAEHPKWLAPVFNAIKVRGKDIMDASAYYPDASQNNKASSGANATKKIGIFIPQDLSNPLVKEMMLHAKKQYESAGYELCEIQLDMFDYTPAVYINISTAEASTNLARFDGIRYGKRGGFADGRLELIRNARNKGFGEEVKTRILTGTFVLRSGFQDQFYIKAQKVRAHIKKIIQDLFKSYDLILLPTTTGSAFRFDDPSMDPYQQKLADTYSVVANLAGVPALSLPIMYKDGLPIGLQAMAPHYAEQRLFDFANATHGLFEYKLNSYAKNMCEKMGRNPEWINQPTNSSASSLGGER